MKLCGYKSEIWQEIKLTGKRLTGMFPWEVQWLIAKWNVVRGDILEIGTFRGSTARELAVAFPQRNIYCVDICLPWYGLKQEEVGEDSKEFENVILTLEDSRKYNYPDSLGMIFIDGDHSWEGVKADTERALAYFRTHKGTIVWHDYDQTHEVMPYLDWLETHSKLGIQMVQNTQMAFLDL